MKKANSMKVLVIAGLIGSVGSIFSTLAMADDWHHDDRRRIEEQRRWDELHRRPHPVVYAPAPVVIAPPPPSPGISIVLPIEIR